MAVTARRGIVHAASPAKVLAFRQHCQRLDQRTQEGLTELVAAVGYLPTPGGITPYLALRARAPRHDRRLLERAVVDTGDLVDLPFARASTVLAPTADAGVVLAAARRCHDVRAQPLRQAHLVDERKRARLCEAILEALHAGPLAADDLRARLPEPLCIPFGEAGKKAGFASLFSLALKELQLDGLVVRLPRHQRLDQEGALYSLPRRPLGRCADRAEALALLARRYFRAYAPALIADFAFWADLTVSEARQAVADADLVAVQLEGQKEPAYLGGDQLEAFLAYELPVPGRLAFVPFRDPSVSGGRDLKAMLGEEHRTKVLADWRGRLVPAGGGSLVHQHFVLLGGSIAGIWEYDEDGRRVRYVTFDQLPTRMKRQVDDAAHELGSYLQSELGQARFYAGEHGEDFGRLDEVTARWAK